MTSMKPRTLHFAWSVAHLGMHIDTGSSSPFANMAKQDTVQIL